MNLRCAFGAWFIPGVGETPPLSYQAVGLISPSLKLGTFRPVPVKLLSVT